MAEIHAIHGGSNPTEPSIDVIEMLEGLLERAKSGEFQAFAYATLNQNHSRSNGFHAEAGASDGLGISIFALHSRYIDFISDEWESE